MNNLPQANSYLTLSIYSLIIIIIIFLTTILFLFVYNIAKNKKLINNKINIALKIFSAILIINIIFILQFKYEIRKIESREFLTGMVNQTVYTQCIEKGYKHNMPYNKTLQICKNNMKKITKLEKKESIYKINIHNKKS